MTVRAVVFDLYDTLVDGGTGRRRAMVGRMAVDLGVDPESFKAAFRDSYRDRFAGVTGDLPATITMLSRRCGVEPDPAAVAAAANRRTEYARELLRPFPGVLDVLSALVAAGWRLGLVTNCSIETEQVWPRTELSKYIHKPVFSCRVGVCKPDPAIYRMAAEALGVEPAECVYVADGAGGELVGARDMGMSTIRVRADGVDHATFGAIGDWEGPVIDDLTRLRELLPAAPGS